MADEFGDDFTFDDEPLPVLDNAPPQQQQETVPGTAAAVNDATTPEHAPIATAATAAATAAPAPTAQEHEFGYDDFEADPRSVEEANTAASPAPAAAAAAPVATSGVRFAESAEPAVTAEAAAVSELAESAPTIADEFGFAHDDAAVQGTGPAEDTEAAAARASEPAPADAFGFEGEEDVGAQGATNEEAFVASSAAPIPAAADSYSGEAAYDADEANEFGYGEDDASVQAAGDGTSEAAFVVAASAAAVSNPDDAYAADELGFEGEDDADLALHDTGAADDTTEDTYAAQSIASADPAVATASATVLAIPATAAPSTDTAAAQPPKPLSISTGSLPELSRATTIGEQLAETRRVRAADPWRAGLPQQSPFASNKHEPAGLRGMKPPPEKDLCNSCETSVVQLHCPSCVRDYCSNCDAEIHRGERALRKHVRQPVSAEANRVAALQRAQASPSAAPVAVFSAPAADSLYNQTPMSSPTNTMRTSSVASVASDAASPSSRATSTSPAPAAIPAAAMSSVAPAPVAAVPVPAAVVAPSAAAVPAESDDYAEDADYGEDDDFDAAAAASGTAAAPIVASAPPVAASAAVSSSTAEPVTAVADPAAVDADEAAAEEADYLSDEGFEPEQPEQQPETTAGAPASNAASAAPAQPAIMVTAPSSQAVSAAATPERGRSAARGSTSSGSNPSVSPVPLSRSAQRIRDAREAQAAQARKAALPIASKAAPAPTGQKGIHPHEQHSFSPQLNVRRKVTEEPKAVLRSTKTAAASTSPVRKSTSPSKAAGEYSESDHAADATDPEEDKSAHTVLEQFFHVLLQDPLAPSSVAPLLEGMRLPVSVLCRSGRPSAVFYSDASGFVRYHAWNAARERKGEAKAKARAMSRTREKEQASSPTRSGAPSTATGIVKATCSSEAAPLLYLFHPHTAPSTTSTSTIHSSGANTAASLTTAAHFLSKSVDASIIDQEAVMRMFMPQLRERNLKFLRKQRHKAARMEQRKAAVAAQRAASGFSPQVEEKQEDDDYSDDNDDDQGSEIEAAKAAKAAAAVPLTLEQQYAEAYARSVNHRGYVNIEAWKAEERALMMARQKAAFLAAEAERAARAADERRQAIEQEKLYVALLIYTGSSNGPASTPLPPPEALTLGQMRLLFRLPVLSVAESCHGWTPPAGFDFLVQKMEHAPGIDHVVYEAEFNENAAQAGSGGMSVARVQNVWRPPAQQDGSAQAAESTASRAHQGFRHAEECYTVKGPPSCAEYTVESPVKVGELVRKFKKVLVNLIKRIAEISRLGRPCVLRAYFQEGVPTAASDGLGNAAADAAPDAAAMSLNATNLSTGLMLPPDSRKKLYYLLFADVMHLAPPRVSKALGALDPQEATELHVLNAPSLGPPVAPPAVPGLQDHTSAPGSFHLFPRDDATGETLLPGLHGYAPPMLNSNVTVDRGSCVKCHAKLASSSSANLIMLRQVLLKWLPNKFYEYPEQLFADVLGVDEDRNCANWHRATVVCCADCIAEIRALKTIPSRTQLAPWLASVAISAVPTASGKTRSLVPHPDVHNPQVQSGTLAIGGGVVVPAPAALPSLLPYLARAPVLHSRGPGHASQLVPAVAFVARKNTSMLEVQGMVGPSAGLGISGSSESAANAGIIAGAAPTKANNIHPSLIKNAALRNLASKSSLITSESVSSSSGLTAPNLSVSSHRESNTLFRAAPTLTSKGLFVMDSSYMDVSNLNPHQHPTHQPSAVTASVYASGRNLRKSATVKSLPVAKAPQPLHHEGGSPSRLVSKLLGHSASAGALQSAKSSIAGGAGTAPAVPHMPLAPTVIFSPVKGSVAGGKTRVMTQAWAPQAAAQTTAGPTALPAVKTASAGRQKQPAAAATAAPSTAASKPAASVSFPSTSSSQSKPLSKVQPPSAAPADADDDAYDDDYDDDEAYAEFSQTQSLSKQSASVVASRTTPTPIAAVYDAPTDRFVSPVAVPTIAAALAPSSSAVPSATVAPAQPKGYSTATVTKAPAARPAASDAYDDEQDGGYYQSHISDDAEPDGVGATANVANRTAAAAPAAAAPAAAPAAVDPSADADEIYDDDF